MQRPEVLLCCSSPAELLLLQGPFFPLPLFMGGGQPKEGGGTVPSAADGPGHPESQLPPGARALNPHGIRRGKQMGGPKPAPLHSSTLRRSRISEPCPCAKLQRISSFYKIANEVVCVLLQRRLEYMIVQGNKSEQIGREC